MTTTATQDKPQTPAKQKNKTTPAREFRSLATGIANSLLSSWVGEERAGEATGRIAAAFSATAAAAKNPADFYACTAQSVGQCIAIAALTQIMPGTGATALAYLVPKRPRKGQAPQMQFWFSHRGLAALASRVGNVLIAVPVGRSDQLEIRDGEVHSHEQDPDEPPMSWDDLRGVIIIVKDKKTGTTLYRGWMPKKLITKRRNKALTQDIWNQWPVEQSMKTAMHYAISRGWCVIDDAAATRALSVEQTQELRVVDNRPSLEYEDDNRPAEEQLADELEGKLSGNGEPEGSEGKSEESNPTGKADNPADSSDPNPEETPGNPEDNDPYWESPVAEEIADKAKGCRKINTLADVKSDWFANKQRMTSRDNERLELLFAEREGELKGKK